MGKRWLLSLFLAVALLPVFFFLQIITSNSYVNWFLESKYSIQSAVIEQDIAEDGSVFVHETIRYRMRKPFRGLYRYIPEGRYVQMEDVKLWTDELTARRVEFLKKSSTEFEARVWLVEDEYSTELQPDTYKDITLHISYTAKYVIENGTDVSQIFRQFWGLGWDSFAQNVTAIFRFPDSLTPSKVYTHPNTTMSRSGNDYTFQVNHIPPNSFAEVRFLFDQLPEMKYSQFNPTLTLEAIKKEENLYGFLMLLRWIAVILLPIVFFSLCAIIYYFLGIEPKIEYQGIYERELPSLDAPDIINAIVKNRAGSVDDDGIASVMMNLYRLDYISFQGEKKDMVMVLNPKAYLPLSATEKAFLGFLRKHSSDDIFDFQTLQKEFRKSQSKAMAFTNSLKAYKNMVNSEAGSKKLFVHTGTAASKLLAGGFLFLSFLLTVPFLKESLPSIEGVSVIVGAVLWFSASFVLLLPKEVFGRWTKEGLEFYKKWENFGKYISDFSAINDYPPDSIIVWEHYLVYATALGIADKVEQVLKRTIPKEVWNEQSKHANLYNLYTYGAIAQWSTLRAVSVASATNSKSGSGGGGFGGGGGGSGGGSGGGGGGAF